MSGSATVEAEVRELVRRRGLDPVTDRSAVRLLVEQVVADYDDRSLTSSLPPLADAPSTARAVYDAVAGFGPLQRFLDDSTVEEVWINEPGRGVPARDTCAGRPSARQRHLVHRGQRGMTQGPRPLHLLCAAC